MEVNQINITQNLYNAHIEGETGRCPASRSSPNDNTAKILKVLNENINGCDLTLCLFMSALHSYRVDNCLRPFPSMYTANGVKDVNRLTNLCTQIPPLRDVLSNPKKCSEEVVNFLSWLLCSKDVPYLKQVKHAGKDLIPNTINKSSLPSKIFEVVYCARTENAWNNRKGSRTSFMAYHGSKLDNFYSILRAGLQQNFSGGKELLYGQGIYLTTEISLSLIYAPYGNSWRFSMLGDKQSIIAVCEVINDINKVKCRDSNHRNRAVNEGSISGDIPEKYYVVTDSEMLRIKYLFLYKENSSTLKCWLYRNIIFFMIMLYLIILSCSGLFSSQKWVRLWKR